MQTDGTIGASEESPSLRTGLGGGFQGRVGGFGWWAGWWRGQLVGPRRFQENVGDLVPRVGVVMVKIETDLGLQRLPSILLQAMETDHPVAVMVERGDLVVECGWQRLTKIQDQIMLLCEAAHVPTIWATQVLEGLTKSGLPSRAEITDAASGSRGPYILQAVASLDDILRREACHRRKNQSVLHPLQNLGL